MSELMRSGALVHRLRRDLWKGHKHFFIVTGRKQSLWGQK